MSRTFATLVALMTTLFFAAFLAWPVAQTVQGALSLTLGSLAELSPGTLLEATLKYLPHRHSLTLS